MTKQLDELAAWSNEYAARPLYFVRPLIYSDLAVLLPTLGVLVDTLYPQGAEKLLGRLENSIARHEYAHVVADMRTPTVPVALSSEKLKGAHSIKLCTFWVSPAFRGQGAGTLLLQDRVRSWLRSDIRQAHGTIRFSRASSVEPLLSTFGFRQIAVELSRYGEQQDEVVYQWRAEWMKSESRVSMLLGKEPYSRDLKPTWDSSAFYGSPEESIFTSASWT